MAIWVLEKKYRGVSTEKMLKNTNGLTDGGGGVGGGKAQ